MYTQLRCGGFLNRPSPGGFGPEDCNPEEQGGGVFMGRLSISPRRRDPRLVCLEEGDSVRAPVGHVERALQAIGDLRCWLYQVEQLGTPRFGEAGFRLRHLRELVLLAGQSEPRCNMDTNFNAVYWNPLLGQLGRWIESLEQDLPPFESWQIVEDQLNEFCDQLAEQLRQMASVTCTSRTVEL